MARGAGGGMRLVLALSSGWYPDPLLIEDRARSNLTFRLVRGGLDFWAKYNRLYFMNDQTNIGLR